MLRNVAVVIGEPVPAFELVVLSEIFGIPRIDPALPGYRYAVCAESPEPLRTTSGYTVTATHGLRRLASADLVVVIGSAPPEPAPSPRLVSALRAAADRGARVASVCTGAFTLAGTGLLDGRRATTHWLATEPFRAAFPAVDLDPDVLYVDNGQIVTSAGAAAGIDMCLYLVARDYGAAVAADAARIAVAPLHRDGGQAQYIVRDRLRTAPAGLGAVLEWLEQQAHRDLTLEDVAARAGLSTRTLNRRFREETGQTPMRWLNGVRIRLAQELLETTDHGVDRIAYQVGFTSPTNFRVQFKRVSGVAPQAYRDAFRPPLRYGL